jgi:hypothetical protein
MKLGSGNRAYKYNNGQKFLEHKTTEVFCGN